MQYLLDATDAATKHLSTAQHQHLKHVLILVGRRACDMALESPPLEQTCATRPSATAASHSHSDLRPGPLARVQGLQDAAASRQAVHRLLDLALGRSAAGAPRLRRADGTEVTWQQAVLHIITNLQRTKRWKHLVDHVGWVPRRSAARPSSICAPGAGLRYRGRRRTAPLECTMLAGGRKL